MRLKLNKTLRAALIAAITVVGTTLPQAYAEVSWNGGPKDSHGYTQVFYLNNGNTASLTDTEHNQFLITSNVNGANPATGEITSVVTKDGALMRISGGNNWGDDRILNPLTIDNVQAGGGTGTVNISTQQWNASRPASDTTVSILAVSGTVGSVENYGVLTLGASGSTINASGGFNNHDGATLTINGSYVFDTRDTSKYTLKSEGSVEWSDATYSQGFKKSTGSSYYAIKGATDGANIGSITDSTGTELTRESSGNYYFTVGAGDFDYTKFYVKADTATLDHDGTGQIVVEKAGATVTVQNATYRVTTGNMNVNIVVNDGSVLETTHSGVNGFITGTLTINAGGIMRIVGEHDAFGWGSKNQCVASLVMEGTSEKEARLELNQSTGNSATMVTDITMKGYSTITSTKDGGSAGFNTFGCAITAENVQNTIDVLDTRRNGVTITVADGGQLTVKKQTINGSDNSAATVVVKQGEGTLFYTGDTKAKGLNIQAGTVDFSGTADLQALTIGEAGTMKVSGGTTTVGGTANVIGNTIELTGGELKLGGTYDLSGLKLQGGGTDYVGGTGIAAGNGFAQTNGSLNVVHVDGGTLTLLEGVVFNYNATPVTVGTDGVVTLPGTVSYSALHVNNGDGVSFNSAWNIAQEHTTDITGVVMEAGTNIDLDKEEASFGLTLKGGATLKAAAGTTTTIGSITGWQDNTLTVTGEGAVILAVGDRTLTGTTKLDVQGKATTNKILLNSNEASLVVGATGDLTLSNSNLTPTKGTVDISGKVYVGHEIDLSNGSKSTGKITLHTGADVTVKDGMWMYSTSQGILLEEGAKLAITGKGVKFTGKEDGSIKVAAGKEMNYNVDNTDALISNVTMEALGDITIANQLANVDVVTGAHTVTLNSNANSVTVNGGGTFTLGEGKTVTNLTVEDGGTIAGGVDAKNVGIVAGGTATFNEGIHEAGIDIEGLSSGATVKNNGDTTAKYTGLQDSNMKVAADTLYAANEDAYVVNNELEVGVIMHEGTGALTLTKVDEDALKVVSTDSADLTIKGITETSLTDLSIGTGATVSVYTDGQATTEGTVTIKETLAAGGGTLLANLTLLGGSTLNVSGGNDKALTLGSELTIDLSNKSLVNLDDDTLIALNNMGAGETLKLIVSVDSVLDALTYGADYDGMGYDELFSRIGGQLTELQGNYTVYAKDDAFGLTKQGAVPEPTTGTLSLLALAALAARRRRK